MAPAVDEVEVVIPLRWDGLPDAQRAALVDDVPSPRHVLGQRVRRAYDELARPWVLVPHLPVLPGAVVAALRAPRSLALVGAAVVVLAERDRRRPGTRSVPPDVPLWAPLRLLERGVCAWWALGHRLRGGMPHRGQRLRYAARTPWWAGRTGSGQTGVNPLNRGSARMTVRHTHRRSRR